MPRQTTFRSSHLCSVFVIGAELNARCFSSRDGFVRVEIVKESLWQGCQPVASGTFVVLWYLCGVTVVPCGRFGPFWSIGKTAVMSEVPFAPPRKYVCTVPSRENCYGSCLCCLRTVCKLCWHEFHLRVPESSDPAWVACHLPAFRSRHIASPLSDVSTVFPTSLASRTQTIFKDKPKSKIINFDDLIRTRSC